MKASKQGIEATKAELSTLLFFAGKAETAVVKFRVDGKGVLIVSATDGKRSVECEASAADHQQGEWLVPGDYCELLRRGANKGRTNVLLKVDAKGLKHALLVGANSRDPNQEVVDKKNGTSTQVSMESLHKLVKDVPLSGSWFALIPKHFSKALDVMSKATEGCAVTVYPPKEPTAHLLLECSFEECTWRAKLQPAAVRAPGEGAEQSDEDDDPEGKQPRLPGTGAKAAAAPPRPADSDYDDETDGDDGIVPDDYAPEASAGGSKKAKKKTAKKSSRKGK